MCIGLPINRIRPVRVGLILLRQDCIPHDWDTVCCIPYVELYSNSSCKDGVRAGRTADRSSPCDNQERGWAQGMHHCTINMMEPCQQQNTVNCKLNRMLPSLFLLCHTTALIGSNINRHASHCYKRNLESDSSAQHSS